MASFMETQCCALLSDIFKRMVIYVSVLVAALAMYAVEDVEAYALLIVVIFKQSPIAL